MNNIKTISALILSGVCATASQAVQPSPKAQPSPHEFTVGLLGNYYQYRETVRNKFFMHLKGYMIGGLAGYSYTTQKGFLFGIDLDFSGGSAGYDSNGTGIMKNVNQSKFEARLKSGKDFQIPHGLTLTPFTGFGVRVKSDYSGGKRSSTGHHGYDRHSTYLYIPVGMKLKKQLNADWTIESSGEFDIFLYGNQKSEGHPNLKQTKGYGARGSIEGVKTLSKKLSVSFGPFINFWHIKDSKTATYYKGANRMTFMEPNNKTIEAGVALKFRF